MDERITETEGHAILRLQDGFYILAEILTEDADPGAYNWNESDRNTWVTDAETLAKSKAKTVRSLGHSAVKLAVEITRASGSKKSIARLAKAAQRLSKTYNSFSETEVR